MNLKVEYGIIAILLLAFLYYFYKHQSLVSDLLSVPDGGNPELKVVKGKHGRFDDIDRTCPMAGPCMSSCRAGNAPGKGCRACCALWSKSGDMWDEKRGWVPPSECHRPDCEADIITN